MVNRKPLTTVKLKKMKQDGIPISMITAYDYPSAILAQEAGIDVILVGDSLGNVVLGYDTTLQVTLDDIIYHTRAVTRAATNCFVVADMPFMTYHGNIDTTLSNVARLMREGLPQSVKMEGGIEIAAAVAACVQAGVPVMGHLGLTPQSVHQFGGYYVQGKNSVQAQKLIDDAKALEQAGAYAIVLELVSESLAAYITEQVTIPTIGIGASASCDGQVLVFHDLLQYGSSDQPKKMVKTYGNIGNEIRKGISEYVRDVKSRQFPQKEHVFQSEDWRE
jgi:3-methyl-2-oxobutanoate hydroxymethyltransferase